MAKSQLEAKVELVLLYHILAPFEREFKFHPTRKWRFDFAWPLKKVAIEVQGGGWVSGKHSRPAGMAKDAEKLNEAQNLGWQVYIITQDMIKEGNWVHWIKKALAKGI
jgi:very-short-patch-repair endonuclease